jgi:hypothetical protein
MNTTTGEVAARIRALRAETVAAVEQRELLGANARRAVIAAVRDGLICRSSADDALSAWGLEAVPGAWTVSGEGLLSYARMHTDEADARAQAGDDVPDELHRLLPGVWVHAVRVSEVALIHGEDDRPEVHPYRVTVQVILRAGVTATSQAGAITGAQTTVGNRLPDLAQADITLTDLTWTVTDGPDHIPLGADADTQPATGTVRRPHLGDDLAAVTAARDTAVEALAVLRRTIRARAIGALLDGELHIDDEVAAERVERFLLDLGLAGLPRAHHATVVADLKLRVHAVTGQHPYSAARDTMQAITTGPNDSQRWTAHGWAAVDVTELGAGWWQVTWWHVYEVWLRGHTDAAHASAAAEALVREDLTSALSGVEIDSMTLTCTDEGFGVDQLLDPDAD